MSDLVVNLKALADETRFRILNLLLSHDLCVGALAVRLGISKPAVSQHLQILRKTGLVRGEKRGYWTHYTVERDPLKQIATALNEMAGHGISVQGSCFKLFSDQSLNTERGEIVMCQDCCEHPEKLKGKLEDCTPEQIKECHGDNAEHPCETGKK